MPRCFENDWNGDPFSFTTTFLLHTLSLCTMYTQCVRPMDDDDLLPPLISSAAERKRKQPADTLNYDNTILLPPQLFYQNSTQQE
jgi:hypothetical protein